MPLNVRDPARRSNLALPTEQNGRSGSTESARYQNITSPNNLESLSAGAGDGPRMRNADSRMRTEQNNGRLGAPGLRGSRSPHVSSSNITFCKHIRGRGTLSA